MVMNFKKINWPPVGAIPTYVPFKSKNGMTDERPSRRTECCVFIAMRTARLTHSSKVEMSLGYDLLFDLTYSGTEQN